MGFDAQEEGGFEEAEGDENEEGKPRLCLLVLSGPVLIQGFIPDWSEICNLWMLLHGT
jgi:hypothetical protein